MLWLALYFEAKGFQPTCLIAPGPSARGTVIAGFSLASSDVSGAPRCTMAPHCCQSTGLSWCWPGSRGKGLLVENRLVGLHPSSETAAERDVLLRLLDIALSSEQEVPVQLLQDLVHENVDTGQRNNEEAEEKSCSLHLKRVTLWPIRCCEEWV